MNTRTIALLAALSANAFASAEKPWLVVNEDNDHFFKLDPSLMTRDGLRGYVDYVARGHVTHF